MPALIKKAFNQAAVRYDHYAVLQKKVAKDFSVCLKEKINETHTILEIGCGTGFLTSFIADNISPNFYCTTDFAFNMVKKSFRKFSHLNNFHFIVMDGENLAINNLTDWVISSLTFQWFKNFEESLQKLWSQTNGLAFTMILSGSLEEWNNLCLKNNIKSGLQLFIKEADLIEICQKLGAESFSFQTEKYQEQFENPLQFVKNLKKIGAHSPHKNYIPNRKFYKLIQSEDSFTSTYHIATCILEK